MVSATVKTIGYIHVAHIWHQNGEIFGREF